MKIGRLTQQVPVVGRTPASSGFQNLWDRICKTVEGVVNQPTGYTAMTGPSDDTTALDTSTATTAQVAARLKALEDRLTALGN